MISTKNLSFTYPHGKKVFSNLNIEEPAGNITGILGKNGAGKTTLLYLLSGLLFPASSQIDVNGHTPEKRLPDFLNDIYIIPEHFYTPDVTISKYLNAFHPFYPKFDLQKCHIEKLKKEKK